MNTLQLNAKKAKSATTPVVKVNTERLAVVQAIKDEILTRDMDDEGTKCTINDILASDDYIWNYYKQMRDARKDLSGSSLIEALVDELNIAGEESGVIPSDLSRAPSWVAKAAEQINKHSQFQTLAIDLIEAKEKVALGPVPMYYDLTHGDEKVNFLWWPVPGTMDENNASMCNPGNNWKQGRDGKLVKNETNQAIPMDQFREQKAGANGTQIASSYAYLAVSITAGAQIKREMDEYEKGFREANLGGPYGEWHDKGKTAEWCRNSYDVCDRRLKGLASKLRDIKEMDMQINEINKLHVVNAKGEKTHTLKVEFDAIQDSDKDGNVVYVFEKGKKPMLLVDKIKGLVAERIGYSTLLNYDVPKAQANGGTWGALAKSGKKIVQPQSPGNAQTGGGNKIDEIKTVNVGTDLASNYALGLLNWLTKEKGITARREVIRPNNEDMVSTLYEINLELQSLLLVAASSVAKIKGMSIDEVRDQLAGKAA